MSTKSTHYERANVKDIYYRPQTKLREGNAFTPVCRLTGVGGCSQHASQVTLPPSGRGGLTMGVSASRGGGLHRGGGMGRPPRTRKAGSTHPTGILSC